MDDEEFKDPDWEKLISEEEEEEEEETENWMEFIEDEDILECVECASKHKGTDLSNLCQITIKGPHKLAGTEFVCLDCVAKHKLFGRIE
jgi:hypothetical protein